MAAWSPLNFIGERLAVSPHRAVLKIFLLPDGDGALEGVNQPAASVERSSTMGGCDHDQHAGFANFEAPETVHEGDIANLKMTQGLPGQRFHLLERHLFIGLVIETERLPSAGLVAHNTFKDHGRAVLAALDAG